MNETLTVKPIRAFDECAAFVDGFRADSRFSDPMLSTPEEIAHNLIRAIAQPDRHIVIGIDLRRQMIGLFSFLVVKEERYLEMLVGLSRDMAAYRAMFTALREQFAGYQADFVFNPKNTLLKTCLAQNGAVFEAEAQRMVYGGAPLSVDTTGVEPLTEAYVPAYLAMHSTDTYWTAEKVLAAKDQFRIFVAIEAGAAVGYLDVTDCFEENEPYDLFVKEAYRRKGYGRKLLAKALERNFPKRMALLVEASNRAVISLCESLGFVTAENRNSLTAHWEIR